ncbi:Protein of unknown function, partial [Gryllus bimaculatus]
AAGGVGVGGGGGGGGGKGGGGGGARRRRLRRAAPWLLVRVLVALHGGVRRADGGGAHAHARAAALLRGPPQRLQRHHAVRRLRLPALPRQRPPRQDGVVGAAQGRGAAAADGGRADVQHRRALPPQLLRAQRLAPAHRLRQRARRRRLRVPGVVAPAARAPRAAQRRRAARGDHRGARRGGAGQVLQGGLHHRAQVRGEPGAAPVRLRHVEARPAHAQLRHLARGHQRQDGHPPGRRHQPPLHRQRAPPGLGQLHVRAGRRGRHRRHGARAQR